MSWATCYAGCNNIHSEQPALMSDGRVSTSWDPSCEANNRLKKALNLETNYDYRQYLIKEGLNVIKSNRKEALNHNKYNDFYSNELDNHNKHVFNGVQDKSQPFGFETSDLKNLYLSRQQLNARKEAPIIRMPQKN
jgi:hypothetical protein